MRAVVWAGLARNADLRTALALAATAFRVATALTDRNHSRRAIGVRLATGSTSINRVQVLMARSPVSIPTPLLAVVFIRRRPSVVVHVRQGRWVALTDSAAVARRRSMACPVRLAHRPSGQPHPRAATSTAAVSVRLAPSVAVARLRAASVLLLVASVAEARVALKAVVVAAAFMAVGVAVDSMVAAVAVDSMVAAVADTAVAVS